MSLKENINFQKHSFQVITPKPITHNSNLTPEQISIIQTYKEHKLLFNDDAKIIYDQDNSNHNERIINNDYDDCCYLQFIRNGYTLFFYEDPIARVLLDDSDDRDQCLQIKIEYTKVKDIDDSYINKFDITYYIK